MQITQPTPFFTKEEIRGNMRSSLKAELQTNHLKFTDAITVKRVYAIARVVDETFKEAEIYY